MKRILFLSFLACSLFTTSAGASTISMTGIFNGDDDIFSYDFTLSELSEVIFRTWSYAGGTNANGDVIPAGGFDPIVTLFDSVGDVIASNDDDVIDTDPTTGNAYDSYLRLTNLHSGNYKLTLTQWANFFDPTIGAFPGSGSTDISDGTRTGLWALDVTTDPVPEPTTMLLFGTGLAGLVGSRFRKKK